MGILYRKKQCTSPLLFSQSLPSLRPATVTTAPTPMEASPATALPLDSVTSVLAVATVAMVATLATTTLMVPADLLTTRTVTLTVMRTALTTTPNSVRRTTMVEMTATTDMADTAVSP